MLEWQKLGGRMRQVWPNCEGKVESFMSAELDQGTLTCSLCCKNVPWKMHVWRLNFESRLRHSKDELAVESAYTAP